MTSSLVGSEMCIRDRAEDNDDGAREAWLRPREPSLSKMVERQTGWPVSYTHLTLPTICSV
eukprot:9792329-Prorocentrum_lima.AAC.1